MNKPKAMDGYVRVSKRGGREGPSYISPKVQKEAIERWADYRGIEILKWHTDEDHSGGTQDRPGIREAIARVESGQTEGIACWRLNRFARNVSDAIKDVERIEKAGAHLALVSEEIDTTGPFGKMILTILLAVATLERDNLTEGWRTARNEAIRRGVSIARPPLGYKRGEDGVFVVDPVDGPLMKRVFRIVATEGVPAAVVTLREEKPDRTWTTGRVRTLLSSRAYLGEVKHGDIVNPEAHKAIVTRGEWEAAQVPAKRKRKRVAGSFPLSGIMLCAGCKHSMVGSATGPTSGKQYRVYRCKYTTAAGRPPCPAPAVVSAARAEEYVKKAWERLMASEGWKVQDEPETDVRGAQDALDEAEAELQAFAADMTLRKGLGVRYHKEVERRIEAVEQARAIFTEQTRDSLQRQQILPQEVVDDPSRLGEAVRRSFRSVEVLRGRGLPINRKIILHPYGFNDREPFTLGDLPHKS